MKKQMKTMEQLKDSRLLFEKKLPPFGGILLLIVTISLIALVVWSMFAHKDYMILSKGTITDRNASYVMTAYAGVIDECRMQEGMLVEKGDVLFTIKSTDYNLQEEQLMLNRKEYETRLEKLRLLVAAIKDDVNYFDGSDSEDTFYYSTYESYKAQIAQNTFDASTYQAYGYSAEQIQAEMEKNQGKLSEIYYSALQSAENSIQETTLQIASIDSQLAALGSGQEEYAMKASVTGVMHMMADYKDGMVVQAGAAVASITPENSDMLIEAYVSTADMARMEEGNEVQIAVDGLIQSVYGNIGGVVESIDSNLTSMETENGQSNSVFKIKIVPKSDYLISKSGHKVNLTNGMTVEARITYDEVTYFNYVLEKLGLLTR